jgi:YHS domain-containing protein
MQQPASGLVEQPVYQQPVGQRPIVAQAAWIADKPGVCDSGARSGTGGPLALEGYCPVELSKHERWTKGGAQWAVTYRGATYHCAGPVQRECFLADPERYVPVSHGCDVVALLDEDRNVAGVVDHCVVYEGRLYMFSSAAAVEKFRANPARYAVP